MESKIMDLVYCYSIANRTYDIYFIDKLTQIVTDDKEIDNYVNNVIIYEGFLQNIGDISCVAKYDLDSKNIFLSDSAIAFKVQQNIQKYSPLFLNTEKIFYINLYVVQILLHELKHAEQNKSMDLNINDINTKLINASFKNMDSVNYQKYYYCLPAERQAEILAYSTILSSLREVKPFTPNLYNFFTACCLERLISGYEYNGNSIMSPTKKYLYGMNYIEECKELGLYSDNYNESSVNLMAKYPLPTRLLYGLPIETEEYIKTQKILSKTNKYQYERKTVNFGY